ncbi:hypothetical protein C3L23_02140 [Nautilia sp. PV-1]|uniref:PDDEXK-like family protein n=1 Tax=Nautilia sp. PV-1 TaxID=2579250 RepID=UPI000FD84573|nr:PD-(D/E)XK nuclease family protein [Nautilia sp. PV-1]AZV46112.1 hypothetical protein C3L23_02140 [Nautilia sp. PV-1]
MEKIKIESLLKQVETINKKYDEIDKITGRNFNVFEAGNIGHLETFHTQLIAELLSPDGSHNQKDKFLRLFLETIGLKNLKLINPKSYAEFVIDNNRRIDILIEDEDFIIGIEAKVYANDGNKQLKDYFEFLKNKNKKEFKLYYLTLDRHLPDDKSLQDLKIDEEVFLLSFENEIYNWLNECIKEVSDVPIIREGLYQYKLLLEKLTNKNTQKEVEVKEIIGKDVESVKAADEIVRNYPDVWYEKEHELWMNLFNFLVDNYFKKEDGWENGDKDIYNIWYDENENRIPYEKSLEELKKAKVRGICLKKIINKKCIYIGVEYGNNYKNCCLWYKGFNEKLNNFKFDKDTESYWMFSDIELRFYPNNSLSFELFNDREFNSKIRKLANELNTLKDKLLGKQNELSR